MGTSAAMAVRCLPPLLVVSIGAVGEFFWNRSFLRIFQLLITKLNENSELEHGVYSVYFPLFSLLFHPSLSLFSFPFFSFISFFFILPPIMFSLFQFHLQPTPFSCIPQRRYCYCCGRGVFSHGTAGTAVPTKGEGKGKKQGEKAKKWQLFLNLSPPKKIYPRFFFYPRS